MDGTQPRFMHRYHYACVQFPAHGHIVEHALARLVDAQRLALLVDVGDHLRAIFMGSGSKSHLPPYFLLVAPRRDSLVTSSLPVVGKVTPKTV